MLISVLFHIPIWPPTGPSEVLKGAGGFVYVDLRALSHPNLAAHRALRSP